MNFDSTGIKRIAVNAYETVRNIWYNNQISSQLDAKHHRAWIEYGYPEQVSFSRLFNAYDRHAAAHGAVHKLLDKCWQSMPKIKEQGDHTTPTQWETNLEQLLTSNVMQAWPKLMHFDRYSLIGNYSGLILQIADGQAWDTPVGKGKLINIIPALQNQLIPKDYVTDTQSEDFGKVKTYQFANKPLDQTAQGDTSPIQWLGIDASRVLILVEGSCTGNLFDGVPFLKAGFNSLIDIEKVSGGSAEGFFKNASRNVVVEFNSDATVNSPVDGDGNETSAADAVNAQVRKLNSNMDAALMLKGGKAYTLDSQQIAPEESWTLACNNFAASVRIPFTILFGQQTGRLASAEDSEEFAARAEGRRVVHITPMLERLVDKLIAIGQIKAPQAGYVIEWDDLSEPSEKEKLERAEKMTTINKNMAGSGQQVAFDENEIRAVAGFEAIAIVDRPEPEDIDNANRNENNNTPA